MKKLTVSLFLLLMSMAATAQNFEWAKSWGSIGYDQYSHIAKDASGNIYITGSIEGTIDFDPGPEIYELAGVFYPTSYLLKLDQNGDFVWVKTINAGIAAITIDAPGNIYTTGNFSGTIDFDLGPGVFNMTSLTEWSDAFITKLDPGGNFLWAKKMGGPKDDVVVYISTDTAGNVYTAGTFQATADFDPSFSQHFLAAETSHDIFLSKLDANGKFVWAKRINGGKNWTPTYFQSIDIDPSGNLYATGQFTDTIDFDPGVNTFDLRAIGWNDAFVLKLDPLGNLVWAKQLGGIDSSCSGSSVAVDAWGNINIVGVDWGNVDFDPGIGILNFPSQTNSTEFIVKLDALGSLQWAKHMGGKGSMFDLAATIDDMGNIYTTGAYMNDTIDLDPGPGVFNLPWLGESDGFISKLDASGNFVWGRGINAFSYEAGIDILVDHSGDVYTSGFFFMLVDLNLGPGTDIFTSNGGSDIFLLKLSQTNVGMQEVSSTYPNKVYPNPSSGIFNLEAHAGSHFEVIDLLGTMLLSGQMNEQNTTLDLSKYASGMYFLKLEDQTIKLIKQ
jgi:hypothetical protein